MAMRTFARQWSKRIAVILAVFVIILAAGRAVQVEIESRSDGARAPYLQSMSSSAVTVRWRTPQAERGTLHYGTAPDRLDGQVQEPFARESHELRITGLTPDTRYYYAVGTDGKPRHGPGEDYWFVTAPSPDQARPARIWVQGDPGYANPTAFAVRDAMLGWVREHLRPGRPSLDLWLTTGDNAYRSGRASEYQAAVFEAYPELLRNIAYWPAYGNHDARRNAFFRIFSLPQRGEAGGVPSGTENYFSFDYGNIHFVFLDSQDSATHPDGPMSRWLRRDLSETRQQWLIAVVHHPPYSKGTHDSDRFLDSAGRLWNTRKNLLPVLESHGVDLVLSGHSHVYERSLLLDCHYGTSDSLEQSMIVDEGDGRPEGDGPYRKAPGPHQGTVYAVVGSSSKNDRGALNHPAMVVSNSENGSLVIDVQGDQLDGYFIDSVGDVSDHFAVIKSTRSNGRRGPCPQ